MQVGVPAEREHDRSSLGPLLVDPELTRFTRGLLRHQRGDTRPVTGVNTLRIYAERPPVFGFDLELRPTDDATVLVVEIAGELDLTNAHDLEEQLRALSARSPVIVLDLNRVLFIDSAALHVLFRVARELPGARLGILCGRASPVARTLEIVALPSVVPTRGSLDEIVMALSQASV